MRVVTFPGTAWDRVPCVQAGLDPEALELAHLSFRASAGEWPYRVVIVRRGFIVAEWNHGIAHDEQRRMASAAKSMFSSLLGIAISEHMVASANARLVDYYPEAMDVPAGRGPKPGRHVFSKDQSITFRQLISNTLGYM